MRREQRKTRSGEVVFLAKMSNGRVAVHETHLEKVKHEFTSPDVLQDEQFTSGLYEKERVADAFESFVRCVSIVFEGFEYFKERREVLAGCHYLGSSRVLSEGLHSTQC